MLYVVEQKKLWGDYGRVLISGYAERDNDNVNGYLLLKRTGPFLPPISFPWILTGGFCVVVSDTARRSLERYAFTGVGFRLAVKHQIVNLPWHRWDLNADSPRKYPAGGEPENYIENQRYDERMASMMPEAWELLPPVVPCQLSRNEDPRGGYLDEFTISSCDYDGLSIFTNRQQWGSIVVTEYARNILSEVFGNWINFCNIRVK